MHDAVLDINDKMLIIKRATLDDAIILDNNYRHLMYESNNSEEKVQFSILLSGARLRIKELNLNK